jgi:ATP-dependent Clp protease ATP-binding subunit ClpB
LAEVLIETDSELKKALDLDLRAQFRPEFLNRIDAIVPFHRLAFAHLVKIVDIQLADLRQRLAERKITLTLDEAALKHLADQGFDPAFGARPLKRVIQNELADPLALKILNGELHEGSELKVSAKDGALVLG